MSKRQPNYTVDEIELIVSGVEKNSKVSSVQTFLHRGPRCRAKGLH